MIVGCLLSSGEVMLTSFSLGQWTRGSLHFFNSSNSLTGSAGLNYVSIEAALSAASLSC